MDGIARSTIAALFYAHPDQVVFADLAADLAASLLQAAPGGLNIHTEYDDVVIFDLPDRRICLAHSDLASDFPQAARRYLSVAAVVVSVGDKPGASGGQRHGDLCQALARRIEISAPADGCVEAESDLAFSEDAFDAALEDILSAYWIDDDPDSEALDSEVPVSPAQPPDPMPQTMVPDSGAVSDELVQPMANDRAARATALAHAAPGALAGPLASRLDREMQARHISNRAVAPRRVPPRAAPARDGSLCRGARAQLTEKTPSHPLVHRSAIHAINAAMLVYALPVGAFLITLGVLGRESLAMSNRAMAITGAGIGLAQNETVAHALAWMV